MKNLNKRDSIDDNTHMLIYFSHSLHDISVIMFLIFVHVMRNQL